jgi:5-(carboxyamino)imidazole ribonucleotide mutase
MVPLKASFVRKVLLAAADSAGLAALKPAADLLASFGLAWSQTEIGPEDISLYNDGLCAVIIASSDAVIPSQIAAQTTLPVIRVPLRSAGGDPLATLCAAETGDLPAPPDGGEPFATVAIGEAGAKNAALLVVSILSLRDGDLAQRWTDFRAQQTDAVLQHPPLEPV